MSKWIVTNILKVTHIKYEKYCVKYLMFYSAWFYKIAKNTSSSSVKHFITLHYKLVNPHADLWCFSQHFSKVQAWITFLSCFRLFSYIGGINNYIFWESLLCCIKATKLHSREKTLLSLCNISTGRIIAEVLYCQCLKISDSTYKTTWLACPLGEHLYSNYN